MKYKTVVALLMLACFSLAAFAQRPVASGKTVHLSGLVVDAETFLPIEAAKLYDEKGALVGTSDKDGYYTVDINTAATGEILFSVSLKKDGYATFTQHEHWGASATGESMYIGLKKNRSDAKAFSEFYTGGSGNQRQHILDGLTGVKKHKLFDQHLEAVKKGNQDILIWVDGKPYLVDEGGWIALKTADELVSINGTKTVKAGEINKLIQRKKIAGMTPAEPGRGYGYYLTTK